MKILFLDNNTFAKLDLITAFKNLGYEIDLFFHDKIRAVKNPDFEKAFCSQISMKHYDFMFSLNYYQQLSNTCQKYHLRYISYVYDCPLVALYSYTVLNSCNTIFLFDKAQYLLLKKEGIHTVHYLPLAANTLRLTSMHPTDSIHETLDSDISFVGSLYNESHKLFDSLTGLSEFTTGYLSAIMTAQLKISGYFFIEELLSGDILKDLQKAKPYSPQPDGTESPAYVYANYFIARKLAEIERKHLLKCVSESYQLKLYTHNSTPDLPHVQNMGAVDYYDVMPYVFQCSKINLNISLRSIKSGIPLRAFDILGSGGFLLSNYQADFLDFFIPGEDFDYYEDENDLMNKIDFYLSHDALRQEMTQNALQKIRTSHTFENRIRTMIEIAE